MKATETTKMPTNDFGSAEVKYDGFRCMVLLTANRIELRSRNDRILNIPFPEVVSALEEVQENLKASLPLLMDGELVCLQNAYASHFNRVQTRSRMTNQVRIKKESIIHPCQWIAFDLPQEKKVYTERRSELVQLCKKANISPLSPSCWQNTLHCISSDTIASVYDLVQRFNGEGLIAKNRKGLYHGGARTKDWLKLKRYRYISVLVTFYEESNGYFHGSVRDDHQLLKVAVFKHGFTSEEHKTLKQFFLSHGKKEKTGISLPPTIVVELACIDFAGGQLREVHFARFKHDTKVETITLLSLYRSLFPLPESIHTTSLDKPLWAHTNKKEYLNYLQAASSFMLPFLHNRALTVIRFPHGTMQKERFYQKHVPNYAPDFVHTAWLENIEYILCNNPDTLLWLGNQLALELHVPFQPVQYSKPSEIVLDLDPPDDTTFHLAREAALDIKLIFERFDLPFFCKTTGGKGLQIHVPLQENAITYEETARFLSFVAQFLSKQKKELYTTERLKRNRKGRLYLDYVQHSFNKTVIAPYSLRESGYIATPLTEEELHSSTLTPDQFTQKMVYERFLRLQNPFANYSHKRVNRSEFLKILDTIQ